MKVLFLLAVLTFCSCAFQNSVRMAKSQLGRSEIDIKKALGFPAEIIHEGGYRILVYADREYVNAYQYGSSDKYVYTLFWIANDVCTNYTVKEEVLPPDRVDIRAWIATF